MNGAEISDWQLIDWKIVQAEVTNLRQRIFVASKENDLKRVGNLQKLMLRSWANRLQSIRRVTQINQGRRTAGVDGEIVTRPEERLKLFSWLGTFTLNAWCPPPTRRVEIPKGLDKTRLLGIPTIRDRIIQAIVKNALEPFWEAKFEATSHGFRPGRSTHDAIEDVWLGLRSGRRQWILDADIQGAFDNICHDKLMGLIGLFPARFLIRKWLKAGVMIGLDLSPTEVGTPQGGVISPLLANIALHGMEEALGVKKYVFRSKGVRRTRYDGPTKVVKYADDFVVLCETRAQAELAVAGQIK
jgi:RNA-directed DNA polymerase